MLVAPDMSVSITETESLAAIDMFQHADWTIIESNLAGRTDKKDRPIDRTNPDVRRMVMAECATMARGASAGTGIHQMDNQYFRDIVDSLLKVHDKLMKEQ